MTTATETKPLTPKGRAAFVSVFEPRVNKKDGKKRYEMVLIFDKAAQEYDEYKDLVKRIEAAVKEKWPKGPPKKNFNATLLDADHFVNDEGERYNGFDDDDLIAIRIWSKFPPNVVDRDPNVDLGPGDFKSGDYCRVSYDVYAYDNESKGVNVGLGNIQKIKNGEALGGGVKTKPADDFADSNFDDEDDDDIPF